ncbi:uncharacterized protein LOC120446179 [Drosophila santomea]|uniref:uncharacterized protein LOC120446179 n=1 Tax=Drosophila santomea TaxID=129105 RepID=UPI0019541CC0|nr:uncharacterized protein LOC120446179 [Drosophila santomea]
MSDYKKALRNAIRSLNPSTRFYACWFHFCQACKKNAKKISGFEVETKRNRSFYTIFMKFLHLPMLLPNLIEPTFAILKKEAFVLNKNIFQRFLTYYDKQWLKSEGPDRISVFKRALRTTSSLEAYNLNLGNKIHTKGHFFFKKSRIRAFISKWRKCPTKALFKGPFSKNNGCDGSFGVKRN